ncbi:MAG: VWA domain-containing protein [Candidatus Eremiobacteraeota bacterium]|nr:VWA domain-containing protein [Candidatus Eremiobacteraeota bacterium]MCW5865896.1 VWA domain-containing protein [Candidatus Eremiobacteraeota bacterium]
MLEFIPDRTAFCHDQSCTVDVMVRITPPRPPGGAERRRVPINLALVIDRSGSMQGEKMELTRQAAALAIKSLTREDRISLVTFASDVETVVASTPVVDKQQLLRRLDQIQAYGSTALFPGWQAGADQASLGLRKGNLNRLVLLTDGQANLGQTNPDPICSEVNNWFQKGLQTTTMGFGRDYQESLLRAMAASGGGNHFYVETPEQLVRYVELELDGLAATVGTRVRLKLEGLPFEPLGEVQGDAENGYRLADLTVEFPLELLFRVTVPPAATPQSGLKASLEYLASGSGELQRVELEFAQPRVSAQERAEMPVDAEVERKLHQAMAAMAREEAVQAMKKGDQAAATRILRQALQTQKLPEADQAQLRQLQKTIEQGDANATQKLHSAQSYSYSRGSVVLGAVEEQLLEGWLAGDLVPLNSAPFMREGPKSTPELSRMQGMLGGLVAGAGEDTQATVLSLETLKLVNGSNRFLPWIGSFCKSLAEAPVRHPWNSHREFQLRVNEGFLACGARAADCGAMVRMAPLLLTRYKRGGAGFWVFLIMGSHLTHIDAASAACSLAWANLLWELACQPAPPPGQFYWERFSEVLRQVQRNLPYAALAPRYDGWRGTPLNFFEMVLEEARANGRSFEESRDDWTAGPHILEATATALYLLECHGHQAQLAMRLAQAKEEDREWLGALVGAALGSMHGQWPLSGDGATAWNEFAGRL